MLLYFPLNECDDYISSSDFAYFESKSKNEILKEDLTNGILKKNTGINTKQLIKNFNGFNKTKNNDYIMNLYLSNEEFYKITKLSNKLYKENVKIYNNRHNPCNYYCMIWNNVMIHSSPESHINRNNVGLLRLSFKNIKKRINNSYKKQLLSIFPL